MSQAAPFVTRADRPSSPARRSRPVGLPDDLLRDSARRLRVVALIYAAGFLIAESFYTVLDPIARELITRFSGWGPGAISITAALIVAALASSNRIPPATMMHVGLAFEVIGAYGIAFSAYWGVYPNLAYEPQHLSIFGLSFVAPWIMFFTIVAPSQPRKALVAAIAAASAVPVTVFLSARYGGTSIVLTPAFVGGTLLFPYSLVVVTAYVGARVVYGLGTAVTQARELGSYRLTRRLGEGGMGEVWQARHRMLARPAAIKLIRPDQLGGDRESASTLRQRFEREAQATALMRSPHTIELYDFGLTADGTFYYVMELLHGFDLETLVERFGPLPPERAVYLLRQVCDSLAEAHDHALIHRDVKPANVFLCRQGRHVDFVKVLDFGLAKPRREGGAAEVKLTADNAASGTPAYMAPEQIAGEPVDARTDLYALGCVAYWLLTGGLVFTGGSLMEVMAHHFATEPVPPSQRSELPIAPELDQVVLSCLAKDPQRRPQSADALDAALGALQMDALWTPERARAWWERHEPAVDGERASGQERIEIA